VSGFDHRFENLIAFSAADEMPVNVARARARGVELEGEMTWHGVRLRANFTAQKARNDDTGLRLQGRAERYGAVDASRRFGAWTVGAGVMASGSRYDSVDESPASRLPAYAVVDARVKYAFAKSWSAELATTNLSGKRYENAVGYDAPRRGVFLQVTFQAF
jgi:vitamin B12 transporter